MIKNTVLCMPKLLLAFVAKLSMFLVLAQAHGQDAIFAEIQTNKGLISVSLNERAAPTTVANFINLARRGFYDGLKFHRWEKGFMVQGGDPKGNGSGGPGYRFRGEIVLRHNQPGILSMANSGPGTDGSQFFITHLATPHLNGLHSVFGLVIEGLDVAQKLRRNDFIDSITVRGDESAISALMARKQDQIEIWNSILDIEFPVPI
jgi:peptidyl-prolyl cis-trans isomerase B (cyclophilin B)